VGINATLYAKGEPVAVNRLNTETYTGGTAYLGKDVLGSVRGISNEYGQLEERYEYDAFGKPYKGDFGNGVGLGYTGKPYDTVTGLYNYGYRDYAPEAARFTTVDPARDGSNWFAYVNNDPVNYVDLWGLFTFQIGGTAIVGGGTGGFVSSGVVVAWDASDPFTIEVGKYTSQGIGSVMGVTVAGSLDITTSNNPNAKGIADGSLIVGGSVNTPTGAYIGISVNSVISLNGAQPATSASIGLGVGSAVETHTLYSNTQVKTKSYSLNGVIDGAKGIISSIGNFFSGLTNGAKSGPGKGN
jgi:RHS repeat-associated protein